jgi:hypothetical protein
VDPAHEIAAKAAQGYPVLQCQECAEHIRNALVAAGFHGQVVELKGREGYEHMVCMSYHEGRDSITENGRHLGVRVGDMVFDNLHPAGMPYDAWVQDFEAPEGFDVRVSDF